MCSTLSGLLLELKTFNPKKPKKPKTLTVCVSVFTGINVQNIIMIVLSVSVVVVTAIALIFYW